MNLPDDSLCGQIWSQSLLIARQLQQKVFPSLQLWMFSTFTAVPILATLEQTSAHNTGLAYQTFELRLQGGFPESA